MLEPRQSSEGPSMFMLDHAIVLCSYNWPGTRCCKLEAGSCTPLRLQKEMCPSKHPWKWVVIQKEDLPIPVHGAIGVNCCENCQWTQRSRRSSYQLFSGELLASSSPFMLMSVIYKQTFLFTAIVFEYDLQGTVVSRLSTHFFCTKIGFNPWHVLSFGLWSKIVTPPSGCLTSN